MVRIPEVDDNRKIAATVPYAIADNPPGLHVRVSDVVNVRGTPHPPYAAV